eukprot:scaffold1481_cov23-Cyclotella_meneghiniana.AAC.1
MKLGPKLVHINFANIWALVLRNNAKSPSTRTLLAFHKVNYSLGVGPECFRVHSDYKSFSAGGNAQFRQK